jgi:hypothetical protein
MMMIRPQPRFFIAGTAARVHRSVDHRLPGAVADLLERPADLADDPAGRVDQDVDRADGREKAGHGGRVGQVGGDHRRPVQGRRLLVDPVNLGSVRRQGRRDRGPDPVGGPGDDRHPACQCHIQALRFHFPRPLVRAPA